MKIFLGLFLCLVFVWDISGQVLPQIKKNGNRVIEVSNLLGSVEGMNCKKSGTLTGSVIKRNFEDDEITLASFILRDKRDKRNPINLNNRQVALLGHYSNETVSTLLSMNARLKIFTFECSGGGSGVFTYADRIARLR